MCSFVVFRHWVNYLKIQEVILLLNLRPPWRCDLGCPRWRRFSWYTSLWELPQAVAARACTFRRPWTTSSKGSLKDWLNLDVGAYFVVQFAMWMRNASNNQWAASVYAIANQWAKWAAWRSCPHDFATAGSIQVKKYDILITQNNQYFHLQLALFTESFMK